MVGGTPTKEAKMATSPVSATPTMDARKTKLLVRFTPESVTTEQYDDCLLYTSDAADE